jgi:DNA-binding response OmpR family regulator
MTNALNRGSILPGLPANVITSEPDLASPIRAPHNAGVTAMRVAIAEADASQANLLNHYLRRGGHHGHHFDRGGAMIHALNRNSFDALVLDWNLRDISGVEVLRRIRGSGQPSVPILVSSTRGDEKDVVNALRQGADDYMIKPVRCLEFVARLEAIARRGKQHTARPEELTVDVYHVDGPSRTLMRAGHPVQLTTKEFGLSMLFLGNVGELLARDHIWQQVWGRREADSSRTLDTHVSRIRLKLGFIPENGWSLDAKYGRGYRLQKVDAMPRVASAPASSEATP